MNTSASVAGEASAVATPPNAAWRTQGIALALVALALLVLFHRDAADMVRIWWTSSTFNHCLIVLPIVGWLVQQRWPAIRDLAPSAWTPGLIVVAGGAVCWLLGEAAGVALGRHLGLAVMLQGAVVALLGLTVARAVVFPLGYALFLVPFGEEFVPALQTLTAKLSMAMLGWASIPAHIEGVFITTPHGWFKVAEACSGAKFVVAMAALATLAAYLFFKTWPRRIAFLAMAMLVPILANGVRAFGTIWYAERYGVEHAAGFDHIIYGWVFFAAVVGIVIGLGWRFADRAPEDAFAGVPQVRETKAKPRVGVTAAAALAIAILPMAWLAASAARAPLLAKTFAAPVVPGWTRAAPTDAATWQPRFVDADLYRRYAYRDAAGRHVDLIVAGYDRQREGRELVGFGQGAIDSDNGWAWSADAGAGRIRIVAPAAVRVVATMFRIGDDATPEAARFKLATMSARLTGGDPRSVAVIVSARDDNGGGTAMVDSFMRAAGDPAALADAAFGR